MLKKYIKKVMERQDLQADEMRDAMEIIMEGKASNEQIASFLTAMRMKKESPIEIAAGASVMVQKAKPLPTGNLRLLDIVGTGGDCLNTFNISTTSAFVLCGAGVYIAKHGNRGVSSKSGSADTLEAMRVNIDLPPDIASALLQEVGITFLFAQTYHESMRFVGPVRKELGMKTMFNILGPLTNPARPSTYVIGAYNKEMADIMIRVYKELHVENAIVVYGDSGMDEVSMTGPTYVTQLRNENITSFTITPEEYGFRRCSLTDLVGGDCLENGNIMMDILNGAPGPKRDAVLFNSALALYAHECVDSIAQGIQKAKESIDSGLAMQKFHQFRTLSNSEVSL